MEFNFPNWLVNSPTYYLLVIGLDEKYIYTNPFFNHTFKHLSKDFNGVKLENIIFMDDFDVCNDA